MIEAGQANAAQNHAGMNPCPGGTGAQGIMAGAANAVSLGSHPLAPQGMPTKPALAGISDGAKKSIAVINTVLTTLRVFIGSPRQQAKLALVGRTTYDISATVETRSLYL
jgi:hypothetical protein